MRRLKRFYRSPIFSSWRGFSCLAILCHASSSFLMDDLRAVIASRKLAGLMAVTEGHIILANVTEERTISYRTYRTVADDKLQNSYREELESA